MILLRNALLSLVALCCAATPAFAQGPGVTWHKNVALLADVAAGHSGLRQWTNNGRTYLVASGGTVSIVDVTDVLVR